MWDKWLRPILQNLIAGAILAIVGAIAAMMSGLPLWLAVITFLVLYAAVSLALAGVIWSTIGVKLLWDHKRGETRHAGTANSGPTANPEQLTSDQRKLIQFCNMWAEPTINNAVTTLNHLHDHMRKVGGISFYAGNLLNNHFEVSVSNALGSFRKACEDGSSLDELQDAAADSYRTYSDMIHPMRDFGQETGYDFNADGNYKKWKELDAKY